MKIFSASRREDMPAFHIAELRARYEIYEKKQPNFWVFWTKNPLNLLETDFDFNRAYLHLTITGLGATPLEAEVPPADRIIRNTKALISRGFKPEHINWRLDPLVPGHHDTTVIASLAVKMKDLGITRCTTSFITWYGHVKKRWPEGMATQRDASTQREIALKVRSILEKYGMCLYGCSQPHLTGILMPGKCIDGALYRSLTGHSFDTCKDPSQRKACGCTKSTDIGQYRPCPHLCVYCYNKST